MSTRRPQHVAHARKDASEKAQAFGLGSFIANLSPLDVFAILGFGFLGCWTFWFAFECLAVSLMVPAVVAFVSAAVFIVCVVLIVRARLRGPYVGGVYPDVVFDTAAWLRLLGSEDDGNRHCLVYCRKSGLTLDFDGAWAELFPWADVRLVNDFGAKALVLGLPFGSEEALVRLTFDTLEDRSMVEGCLARFTPTDDEEAGIA